MPLEVQQQQRGRLLLRTKNEFQFIFLNYESSVTKCVFNSIGMEPSLAYFVWLCKNGIIGAAPIL